jgi:Fe-S-cluster-containing hydrogenase component 2
MIGSKMAFIEQGKCHKCHPCPVAEDCPTSAIQEEDGFLYVGPECSGCGNCVRNCPYKAIELK